VPYHDRVPVSAADKLKGEVLTCCQTHDELAKLLGKLEVRLPEDFESREIEDVVEWLIADTTLSGRFEELRKALRKQCGPPTWLVFVSSLLVATFLASPVLLRDVIPWLWLQLAEAGAVLVSGWSIFQIVRENSVLRFLQWLVAERDSFRRLLIACAVTYAVMVGTRIAMPAADSTILLLLPYGSVPDRLKEPNAVLVVRYGDKEVARFPNPGSGAVYLGWPVARLHWVIDEKDGVARQDRLKKIAEERAKTPPDKKLASDLAQDWDDEAIFPSTPNPKPQTKLMVSIEADGKPPEALNLIDTEGSNAGIVYTVRNSNGVESVLLDTVIGDK